MIAATIFLAAFLLFQVQPMVAKQVLPTYGGSAAVWTVCLLFFQTSLLVGYAWAHWTRRAWHAALLAGSVPVLLLLHANPAPGAHPTLEILKTLLVAIGLPFITLAASSPLLQRWSGSAQPYRLYAVSNAACLLALLSYPFLIEPWLSLNTQFEAWQIAYLVFAGLSLACVLRKTPDRAQEAPARFRLRWFALAAAPSALLMATTNQMCQEIAAVPFLWVAPLAIYLLTFVLAFDRPQWYHREAYSLAGGVLVSASAILMLVGLNVEIWVHLTVYSLTLFCCLMLCHGELNRSRPVVGSLTRFYLGIAAGGAFGGALVALAAPAVFHSYAEFPLSLAACLALAAAVRWQELRPQRASTMSLAFGFLVALAVISPGADSNRIAARRDFYGVLRVTETDGVRKLTHGATLHGSQFLDAARRDMPTTYYSPISGAGLVLSKLALPAHIGVIGLGTGTLAAYGRPGDRMIFYEINPQVISLAHEYFTYLADSKARITIVEGDARLSLRDESPQGFDALIVDAFSSDSIPMHLLTIECGEIYKKHMAPGGKLLFHISNRTLELEPVVRAIAQDFNWGVQRINSGSDPATGASAASWMVLDPDTAYRPGPTIQWTDQFASLWSVLK